jgi:pimeloyl-ACP methyl ester carboxylesterase
VLQVNLKADGGRDLVLDLMATADAVLEGFRPGVADRLGVGFATVSARKPGIIYCPISGPGQDGPMRRAAAQDVNVEEPALPQDLEITPEREASLRASGALKESSREAVTDDVVPASKFAAVNRLQIHYLDWNSGGQRPVILIHGINVQAHTWEPIAEALARHRRVIAVDLRGHGDSEWARQGYALSSFVADLLALADHLGLATFDLVGHSLGARVALAAAGEFPDRVTRLVLSDTGPEVARGGAEFSRDIVASTSNVRGFKTRDEVLEHYRRLHPDWQPVFLELHATHQVRANWAGRLVFKSDPELFWLTGSAGARENPYLWEICERIKAPVLIMWGTRSPFLDQRIADRMLHAMPSAELVRIDAGHYIPREVPTVFISVLSQFLDRPAGQPGGPRPSTRQKRAAT